jgi:hypothetical protein
LSPAFTADLELAFSLTIPGFYHIGCSYRLSQLCYCIYCSCLLHCLLVAKRQFGQVSTHPYSRTRAFSAPPSFSCCPLSSLSLSVLILWAFFSVILSSYSGLGVRILDLPVSDPRAVLRLYFTLLGVLSRLRC